MNAPSLVRRSWSLGPPLLILTALLAVRAAHGEIRDGALDAVAAHETPADRGPAGGSFRTAATVTIPTGGEAVAVGDFNGDHRLDAAFAWTRVSLQASDGTFLPPTESFLSLAAADIEVGDFDADGILDLVVARTGKVNRGGNLSLLLGNGDGTFHQPVNFPLNANTSDCVVGDFNGDGRPDVAVAEEFSGVGLCVFPGALGVPFGARRDIPLGAYSPAIAAGDFDRDGLEDVALTTYSGATSEHQLRLFFGVSDPTPLSAGTSYSMPMGRSDDQSSVDVGDVDGDGWPDVVVLARNDLDAYTLNVFLNAHDRTFVPRPERVLSTEVHRIAVGDLNADGLADVATANNSNNTASVFPAIGHGDLGAAVTYAATVEPNDIAIADMNADGLPDLVVGSGSPSVVILNPGDLPTPVQITLLRTLARSDRVRLTWWAGANGDLARSAWVERRVSGGEWIDLGPAEMTGELLSFEDATVRSGARYDYRLRVLAGGREEWLGEVSIDVPGLVDLALDGVSPNPAPGSPRVAFRLPDDRAAVLEVIDVSGRVRTRENVGALASGGHSVRLDTRGLGSGLYFVRLTRGSTSLVRRFTIAP